MSNEFLVVVLAVIGAIQGGLVIYLTKLIAHNFQVKLSSVEAGNTMQTLEHQVRFTRFDEKVAVAIEGGYELVCEYRDAVMSVISQSHEDAETFNEAYKQVPVVSKRFNSFIQRQSIYLPEELAGKMNEIRIKLRDEYNASLGKMRNRTDKTILYSIFEGGNLERKCDALMFELQKAVREHLNQFVLSSKP